jgi:amino acid transporter
MKHSPKNFLHNALMYGLYLGGISIFLTVVYYLLDLSMFNWIFSIINGIVSITLAVVFIVMAIKKYRLNFLEGRIKYHQCVLIGFVVLIVSGLLTSIFTYILYNLIDPGYMTKQLEMFIEQMQSYNLPEGQLNEIIDRTKEGMESSGQLMKSLIYVPAFAAVLSLIISIFVRKKDNTFESNVR